MKGRRSTSSGNSWRIFPLLAVLCAANMGLMSSLRVVNAGNPGVDLLNPYVAKVLCEYYGLAEADELTEAHLNGVYSMEFCLSPTFEAWRRSVRPRVSSSYLVCKINELPNEGLPLILWQDLTFEEAEAGYCDGSFAAEHRLIESAELDLRDIVLFHGLKVLIFRDGLYTVEPGIYDNAVYAVIGEEELK